VVEDPFPSQGKDLEEDGIGDEQVVLWEEDEVSPPLEVAAMGFV
jgi:hypothetical protein